MAEESYIASADEDGLPAGVEFSMANKLIKNLNILMSNSEEPITVHMHTVGGNWSDGIAMYDAIKSCKCEISIINYSEARSMSSLIYLAADKRLIHKHGKFMFHLGTTFDGGTTTQFNTAYAESQKSTEQMLTIYIEHLYGGDYWKGKTKLQIKNWLMKQIRDKEDVYFSAEESIEIGFADEIIEGYV